MYTLRPAGEGSRKDATIISEHTLSFTPDTLLSLFLFPFLPLSLLVVLPYPCPRSHPPIPLFQPSLKSKADLLGFFCTWRRMKENICYLPFLINSSNAFFCCCVCLRFVLSVYLSLCLFYLFICAFLCVYAPFCFLSLSLSPSLPFPFSLPLPTLPPPPWNMPQYFYLVSCRLSPPQYN